MSKRSKDMTECVEMADLSRIVPHQIMLRHMAETWERIAKDIELDNP